MSIYVIMEDIEKGLFHHRYRFYGMENNLYRTLTVVLEDKHGNLHANDTAIFKD